MQNGLAVRTNERPTSCLPRSCRDDKERLRDSLVGTSVIAVWSQDGDAKRGELQKRDPCCRSAGTVMFSHLECFSRFS